MLILGIFISFITGFGYTFTRLVDVTHAKKYTLSEQSNSFLEKNEHRIDIVLYESAEKRKDIYSGYALYAEYVERFLNLVEQASHGSIRTEIVHVEPFSSQERALIRRSVPYTEDSFGHKLFMAADFTDNDGIKKCKCDNEKCFTCSNESLSYDLWGVSCFIHSDINYDLWY